jgi:SAM-dependent methyltransferase
LCLRRRLDEFYASTTSYSAFSETFKAEDRQMELHELIFPLLRGNGGGNSAGNGAGARTRVLELGAGRPTFPQNLGERRAAVEYHAHDVTAANADYLAKVADRFFIGDCSQIQGSYDLIFSTFVVEHLASPEAFLAEVKRLLAPGGTHVLFCPRYDMPGYVCPSLRHLGRLGRWRASAFMTATRLMAVLDGKTRFWLNLDPAVFHRPWFRDADAVHLVSRRDIERWHRANGFEVRRLYPRFHGWRDRIVKRYLLVALACRKTKGDAQTE